MIQQWDIANVKELDFASPIGLLKVREFLPHVEQEIHEDYTGQYSILTSSLIRYGQTKPLRISAGSRLRDGIHRLAIMSLMEWTNVIVSTEPFYNDWDESPEGQQYWYLWNKRLEGFGYEH